MASASPPVTLRSCVGIFTVTAIGHAILASRLTRKAVERQLLEPLVADEELEDAVLDAAVRELVAQHHGVGRDARVAVRPELAARHHRVLTQPLDHRVDAVDLSLAVAAD